jgi:hypothetical protein
MKPAPKATFVLVTLCLTAAAEVRGQECPDGRISSIFIDNHSIFDEETKNGRFEWAYSLANRFHIRTRQDFIAAELLFHEGECLDPFLLDESGRILRQHRFIAIADVFAVPLPDGTHDVVVDTQDEWTTKVNVGVAFDQGFQFEKLDVVEENFLGRGLLLGFFFEEKDERRDIGVSFETPRLFSSRWDARLTVGNTRIGDLFEQGLFFPFVAEVGRVGAREKYLRQDVLFPFAAPGYPNFTHVAVPMLEEIFEATGAIRLGRPGDLTVLGLGVSRHAREFPDYPGSVDLVLDGDFSNTAPAGPDEVAAVDYLISDRSSTRVNFILGQRNLQFIRRRGLDALTGVQDVAVGTEIGITLGRSLGVLERRGLSQPDDLYTQVSLFAGAATGPVVSNSAFRIEARQVFAGAGGEEGWRDILAELDAYAYWQPRRATRHTFFGRVSASGGWSMVTPFQLTLGGREGLRGYDQDDFPGGRRVLFTLEDRIRLNWPAPNVVDSGFTVFVDAGRMVSGDVPFGVDSGWRASLGAGLRLGFPAGTRNTARIDVSLPVERGATLGDLVVRVSARELLGIALGFDDTQMLRSRALDSSTDFRGVQR